MIRFSRVPHSIRLLLTDICNLNCSFCLANASAQPGKDDLGTGDWLRFFDRLKELQVFNISLSGGEIFLRGDLFVLLRKLRENRSHRLTLLTNGTLISDETVTRLKELNIKNVSISVDGLQERHDSIRGKGAFAKTIDGIRRLIAGGIFPQVSFTPIAGNYQDLGPVIDRIATLGVLAFQVNTLSPHGRCLEIYKEIVLGFPGQVEAVLQTVEEKKVKYPQIKIACQLGFYYHLPESYAHYLENPQNFEIKHLKDGCGAASTSCAVMPNGDVVPCDGFSMFVGGNIKNRDLLEIWNESEAFNKIRNLGMIPMDQNPHCKDCRYIYLCDGGCRASAYLVYRDLLAPSINCPYWKEI